MSPVAVASAASVSSTLAYSPIAESAARRASSRTDDVACAVSRVRAASTSCLTCMGRSAPLRGLVSKCRLRGSGSASSCSCPGRVPPGRPSDGSPPRSGDRDAGCSAGCLASRAGAPAPGREASSAPRGAGRPTRLRGTLAAPNTRNPADASWSPLISPPGPWSGWSGVPFNSAATPPTLVSSWPIEKTTRS